MTGGGTRRDKGERRIDDDGEAGKVDEGNTKAWKLHTSLDKDD